jgi:4-diphosphocytidyl-2-C-methyl-D-erythritol kinase
MTAIREIARAKVNLTLSVLGRRPDGYHDIESLVAFADFGDVVSLEPGADSKVTVSGPFAAAIDGPNLLEKTLDLLSEAEPRLRLGAVALEKNLPVAAGLGGGSADAAALLRAGRRANPALAGRVPWEEIAARLSADVPVCLASRAAVIAGIGEWVEPLALELPPMFAVLANPRQALPTAAVYRALGAPANPALRRPPIPPAFFAGLGPLIEHMRARGNDLERPATSLLPVIADLKSTLAALPGCLHAALSGSGPTCFGIFADEASAIHAAAQLAASKPHCWIRSTRLSG